MQYIQQINTIYLKNLKKYWGFVSISILSVTIASISRLLAPLYYKKLVDSITLLTPTIQDLFTILYTIAGLHFIIFIGYRVLEFSMTYWQTHIKRDLVDMSFAYTQEHSYSFFADNFGGSLLRKLGRLDQSFEKITDKVIINIYPTVLQLISGLVVLYFSNPLLSYIMIIWTGFFILGTWWLTAYKLTFDNIVNDIESRMAGFIVDCFSNNINIKFFDTYKKEVKKLKTYTSQWQKKLLKSWYISHIGNTVQHGSMWLVNFALLYTSIVLWGKGLVTAGDFVLLMSVINIIFSNIIDFARQVREVGRGYSDAKEIIDILHTPHQIKDAPQAKPLIVKKGEIIYNDLSFSYDGKNPVFDNFNLHIKAGEKVAFVSKSGEGKSTLIKLLLHFYNINTESIFIDDQDITKITQGSLRQNIALVPQDPILFHRSLKENICYGIKNIDEKHFIKACKLAHCHEFISKLPEQYETFVGERGVKLSGGQRQRVAIARAILKNTPILILDEATSSLDSQSERGIQDALKYLMKDKTAIVIAHRLSTIQQMDRIIVLHKGKIIEEGTHKKLLGIKKGYYKKLWDLQVNGFIE